MSIQSPAQTTIRWGKSSNRSTRNTVDRDNWKLGGEPAVEREQCRNDGKFRGKYRLVKVKSTSLLYREYLDRNC